MEPKGKSAKSKRRLRSRKPALHSASHRDGKRGPNVVGVVVKHHRRRPNDAVAPDGPNLAEQVSGPFIKSPFFDDLRHAATYDLNKELFENVKGGLTVKVGRGFSK